MNLDKMTRVADVFRNELAARYDLPEMTSAQWSHAVSPSGDVSSLKLTTHFLPRGQFAGIARSAAVTLDVWHTARPTSDGRKSLWQARMQYSYQHHGGGSNGKDVGFVLATRDRYAEEEYLGFVERSVMDALRD